MKLAQKFARSGFARFINSKAGRIIRIIAGVALIIWGCVHLGQTSGLVLVIVGIVPLAAGTLDLCVMSPLLGGPISGKKVRSMSTINSI